jgi:hypothetical protein
LENLPVDSDRDHFDEVANLRLWPDIARAVAEGRETGAKAALDPDRGYPRGFPDPRFHQPVRP